jgi:hypothetical protein
MLRTPGFAMLLGLVLLPGCGFRDREGLLARFRARAAGHDYVYSAPIQGMPLAYSVGVPVGLPTSMHGNLPCPCGAPSVLPGYSPPETLQPGSTWPPNYPTPTVPQQPGTTQPGTAPPKPAEPSDSNGGQKPSPLSTAKPNSF